MFWSIQLYQLQEIISSRLKGINAFEEHAIEFASRKVCILFVLMSISLLLFIVLLMVCLV
jgi:hypothetical protein